MKEDFGLKNDTDRQKYLNDLERLRRIKENERYNSKNKSVSEYIEDYYYDAEDYTPTSSADVGYGEYEEYLNERNKRIQSEKQRYSEEDLFERNARANLRSGQNHDTIRRENHDNDSARHAEENKRKEFMESKNKAESSMKRNYRMPSGLRLPELDGNLEKKRMELQAQREARRKKELEEAAIAEQKRRDEELVRKRRARQSENVASESTKSGSGASVSRQAPSIKKGIGIGVAASRQNPTAKNGNNVAAGRPNPMKNGNSVTAARPNPMKNGNSVTAARPISTAKNGNNVAASRRNPTIKTGNSVAVSRQNPTKNGAGSPARGASKKENSKTPVPFGKRVKKFFGNLIKIILVALLFFGGILVHSFYTKQEGYYTIAIFGVDSRDGNVGKDALADVNMIANINRETGAIQLVSVYRDMITEIDGNGNYHKLNEAYFKGGASRAVAALERNLDLDIEGYATFNWKAVVDGINILGGIDLEITEAEFKYINSFITETVEGTGVGSHHLKHAGMNHLDGVQAVAYARLRLMDTDFNRTERQRKVVKLAMEKAKQADFATINNIIVTILPQIATNMTPDDLIPFAKDMKKYYLAETTGFPFELVTMNIGKRDYVVPVTLKSNVIKLHSFLYGESGTVNYTPSAKLKEISKYIISVSGQGEDTEDIQIKVDQSREGGIGPTGGGSSSTKVAGTTKSETAAQDTTQSETETMTTEETTTKASEETEESADSIEPQTLAPETTETSQDRGDFGIPDENDTTLRGPGADAESDDAQNGPGVNP